MEHNSYHCRRDFKAQTLLLQLTVLLTNDNSSKCVEIQLADGSWITVRPSGTKEPKIKFYIAVVGKPTKNHKLKIANIETEMLFVK